MAGVVSLRAAAEALTELWSPRAVAELDDDSCPRSLREQRRPL